MITRVTISDVFLQVLSLESLLKETQDGVNVLEYLRQVSFWPQTFCMASLWW